MMEREVMRGRTHAPAGKDYAPTGTFPAPGAAPASDAILSPNPEQALEEALYAAMVRAAANAIENGEDNPDDETAENAEENDNYVPMTQEEAEELFDEIMEDGEK